MQRFLNSYNDERSRNEKWNELKIVVNMCEMWGVHEMINNIRYHEKKVPQPPSQLSSRHFVNFARGCEESGKDDEWLSM